MFLLLLIAAVPRCHRPCGGFEGADSMGSVQRDDLSCSPLGFPPSSTRGGACPLPGFSVEGAGGAGTGGVASSALSRGGQQPLPPTTLMSQLTW